MSRKLSYKSLNLKKYWCLLKTLLNSREYLVHYQYTINYIYHKLPQIYIKAKCDPFNSNFAGQFTPLVNNSQLSTRFTTHIDSVLR